MAHKYVAQRYKCWAEFRANNQALLIGLLISFFGLIIIAPGGVFIRGATREQHGRIAFAGPMTNAILAAMFYGLMWVTTAPLISQIMLYGVKINALLGVFNLIPFPPFDGYSVWHWNKIAWVFGIAASGIFLVLG